MKKIFLLSFSLTAIVCSLFSQSNLTQATIKKTGDFTVTIYAKPMFDIVNAPDINLNFAVSLEGTSGPGPISAESEIGGSITASDIEIFGDRRCYPYVLSSSAINMTGGADNPIATVVFPASLGQGINVQLNDYTGSGAAQAYWYISHSGDDQTPYSELFYGNNATNNEGGDSYVDIDAPLPVSLVSFRAEKFQDRSSSLSWSTASEFNTSHFTVQRSSDRKVWSNVGKVQAAGNSQMIQNYQFIDENVYNGRDSRLSVYYRLQMVDLDGQQKNSPIENVLFGTDADKANAFTVAVFPNPASEGVNVEWDAQNALQPTVIEMFDVSGKQVLRHIVAEKSNREFINFGSANVQSGLYLLRLMNGSEALGFEQIVVGQNR